MDVACMTERTVYLKNGEEEHALVVPVLGGSTPHARTITRRRRTRSFCSAAGRVDTLDLCALLDSLSNAALVAFSACAVGSVKGYNEVYPELLDIVKESKLCRGVE
ncbi:hypothetical protein BC937DRAFT_95512 [Endogone sp. FLAS-F59071]|nr:hypothetical protein BC937DRAFT_95512 [Endogone sp. FLAS-F59071]|eukprot:RUS13314.1 hypothetical protein BC937DRAFT_95512 [Endogone sp. FLAS-F59071]